MRIREVEEADLPAALALEQEVFGEGAYPAFVLRQAFDAYASVFLVAEEESLLGFVLGSHARGAEAAWILSLGVAPAARGRGAGRALMNAAIEQLDAPIRLHVAPDNTSALELYRSLGFELHAEVRDCFGPGAHRLILHR